jgi:putative cell wall-binding protein
VTPPDPAVDRIWGTDRYRTAVEVSQANFASGSVGAVCLASGEEFADALTASGLAGAVGGPVLLTQGDSPPRAVLSEISRLGATTVYVIGGFRAVPDSVVTVLEDRGLTVQRLWGSNRYVTAVAVANRIAALTGGDFANMAFLVRGDEFADALAVSPFAYSQACPVLLSGSEKLPVETRAVIGSLGIEEIFIAGGEAAISEGVATAVQSVSGVFPPQRLWGADRYKTARAVAQAGVDYYWGRPHFVGIATGVSFPDALGGGAAAGQQGGVLLLTDPNALSSPTRGFCIQHSDDIEQIQVFGGTGAVSDDVPPALQAALQ